ncbi:hypothetical protein [Luteimonas vadosa]
MQRIRTLSAGLLVLLAALLLSACGDEGDRAGGHNGGTAADGTLPAPEGGSGSVTGMPDAPGPRQVAISGAPPAPAPDALPGDPFELPPLEDNPETGLLAQEDATTVPGDPAGPGPAGVVRDYYAAINAGNYGHAYSLWSDGGRSSGQSPDQFADAFTNVAGIEVQVGELEPAGGTSGSSLVQVPVAFTSTRRDGTVQRYRGTYVLRRPAGDGGPAAWRIASADLREVQP